MADKELNYKFTVDFGPFVLGMQRVQRALARMHLTLNGRKYISTSYAPKLGPGTDI